MFKIVFRWFPKGKILPTQWPGCSVDGPMRVPDGPWIVFWSGEKAEVGQGHLEKAGKYCMYFRMVAINIYIYPFSTCNQVVAKIFCDSEPS